MAESTLSFTHGDIRSRIGYDQGFGSDEAAWTTLQEGLIDRIAKDGYNEVYSNPNGHRWSFLTPTLSLNVWPDLAVDSGITVSASASTTVTASAAAFHPSMLGKTITITGVGDRVITGYTSTTVITVSSAVTAVAATFAIASGNSFRLPDNFASLIGDITYSENNVVWTTLQQTSEFKIREFLQANDFTGYPYQYALRPVVATETTGERWEVLVYPRPDAEYVLLYNAVIAPNMPASDAEYPLGGMNFSKAVLQACLAHSEWERIQDNGPARQLYEKTLQQAIVLDGINGAPANLGRMGPRGSVSYGRTRATMRSPYRTQILYNGVPLFQ